MWRDPSGYSCKAYQYGNFCKESEGAYGPEFVPNQPPDGLWDVSTYGPMFLYSYKTYIPEQKVLARKDARFACCVCGGGIRVHD